MKTDNEYLERLRQRDPATCTHFYYTFAPVLENMLRYRCRDKSVVEDIRNETLRRVILLNDKGQVREAERFGGFVCGVGKMVKREHEEKNRRLVEWPQGLEPHDRSANVEDFLVARELTRLLEGELSRLSSKERTLVDQVFYKLRDRKELAKEEGLTPSGINVRLFKIYKKLRRGIQEKANIEISPKQRDAGGHKSKEGLNDDTSRRSASQKLDQHLRTRSVGG